MVDSPPENTLNMTESNPFHLHTQKMSVLISQLNRHSKMIIIFIAVYLFWIYAYTNTL